MDAFLCYSLLLLNEIRTVDSTECVPPTQNEFLAQLASKKVLCFLTSEMIILFLLNTE